MISVFSSEVLEIKNLEGNVKILKLFVPENFVFKAGQYVSISVPFHGKKLRRPYSIASPPGKNGFIELCIKIVDGLASNYVKTLSEGDEIELFGPLGKFVFEESSKNKDVVFVSAGTGVTPFVSMIPNLLENGFKNKIILIKGFRYEENILYDKEFSELRKKCSNFEFHDVLSRPKNPAYKNKGYVQDFLEKFVPKENCDIYICGLSPMINSVKEKSLSLGIPENRIFFEKYD
ncbi:FAD-dependent oxidoreductase [Candidatus Pacearchaeota archaeon]|nr:FAD-dependent oxidoreductase [Candidatus Pacearchaeota archaeon]